jgi:uncharacterized Ntn-hydrolase superfamily protein
VTFSLVACDLEARQWGVVVASKFLAVGAVVPAAEAEVGALATQAFANLAYRPDGLDLLRGGASAQETVERLKAGDPDYEQRQVGVVDAQGGSAAYTGPGCFDWAGDRAGPGFAAQGNLLAGPQVVAAVADTFEGTSGPLAERMLAALAAGDEAGGDRRGRQAAAVVIRKEGAGYGGSTDLLLDLRIDDHPDPVTELQRLYAIHDLLFGHTPEDRLIPLEQVTAELSELLAKVGYDGDVDHGLRTWAGMENLEERLYDGRIDPVVLRALREAAESAG